MIAQLEEDKRNAPAENQKDLATLLEEYKRDLASVEQSLWALRQETIDAYKKYSPYVYIRSDFVLTMIDAPELDSILKRYLAGHMDWKQFVTALEERLEKIKSE